MPTDSVDSKAPLKAARKRMQVRWSEMGTLELRDNGGTMYVLGKEAPLVSTDAALFYARDDAARAVACLNACEGIADPGETVGEMLEAARRLLDTVGHDDLDMIQALEALEAIVAKAEGRKS